MPKHSKMSMIKAALPPHLQAYLREERRLKLEAAKVFARVCEEGDADQLYNAHELVENANAWPLAMRKVAQLGKVSQDIQEAFVAVWVEHKHLSLAVGDRRVCAAALRILMPGGHKKPMLLYRGDHARRRRIHGFFSWTTDINMARNFARRNTIPPLGEGGVLAQGFDGAVLRTMAPASAILLVIKREDYYDEDEVVVDPYKLSKIEMIERFPATEARRD
jgi:hypothetical protein